MHSEHLEGSDWDRASLSVECQANGNEDGC